MIGKQLPANIYRIAFTMLCLSGRLTPKALIGCHVKREPVIRRASAFLLAAIVILSALSAVSQAEPQPLLTRHTRDVVANGRVQMVDRLPATQTMLFDIVLALRHPVELQNFLDQLHDPTSRSYHQYVTPKEFTERFGPSKEDYEAVISFAKANGFTVIYATREGRDVQLKGTVAALEKALHVTMGVYQHDTENRTFFAPDREPTVDLPFQLWHISGLDNYSIPHPNLVRRNLKVHSEAQTGSCPEQSFCGSDMRAAYYGTGPLTGKGQNLALLELDGTDLVDLTTYYKNAGQTEPYTPTLISTGGYPTTCLYSQACDDTEQTIDMTQAMGMAPGSTMLYMYVCGQVYVRGIFSETDCLSAMVTDELAPLSSQISDSWSWGPADPQTDDPYFEQMAAQGQSFFAAAGDTDEWSSLFLEYPQEDANVICVGGTDLTTQSAGGPWQSETTWEDTGGGISPDDIPIPSWQQLPGVINSQNEGSTVYRNGPDVAANANWTFYVCADQLSCTANRVGGTSFAAPMWAGLLALANEQAVQDGVSAPGFIDPAIYPLGLSGDYSSTFHDITTGDSNGFPVVAGYDLDTGWGSPIGPALINALTGPQPPAFTLTANPSSLSVKQGDSGTSTITVNDFGGFNGNVTLSASGQPSGVTAGLKPNPTATTSTLALTVGAGVPPGTYTITINGVSGSLTGSTTVSLTVTSSGPFVSLNPTSLTWGKVKVGEKGAKKKVTLTNTGGSTLDITSVGITSEFVLVTLKKTKTVTPCVAGLNLAPGGTCEAEAQFAPTQTGPETGSLNFTDNAPGSPQSVALSGTGK